MRIPFGGHEGLQELEKIAVRFEEKIYTTATSQVCFMYIWNTTFSPNSFHQYFFIAV